MDKANARGILVHKVRAALEARHSSFDNARSVMREADKAFDKAVSDAWAAYDKALIETGPPSISPEGSMRVEEIHRRGGCRG